MSVPQQKVNNGKKVEKIKACKVHEVVKLEMYNYKSYKNQAIIK